jgi:GTP-binding protein
MKDITFVKAIYTVTELPDDGLPEIALCGRSNVGKSSFINSIFHKKQVAKTSSTPGKTRSLNYYLVDKKFYLVDLPGYGFARVGHDEKKRWAQIIDDYMTKSKNLQMVFHLLDSRHKPTELDINMNAFLRGSRYPYSVIMSKTDKLKQSEVSKSAKQMTEIFPELSLNDNLFPFSSIKPTGHKNIARILDSLFG